MSTLRQLRLEFEAAQAEALEERTAFDKLDPEAVTEDDLRRLHGADQVLERALCRQMTKNVKDWEAMPPQARAEMAKSCAQMFPGLKSAADERLRQFRAGEGPGR